jgi:hypothetical protein
MKRINETDEIDLSEWELDIPDTLMEAVKSMAEQALGLALGSDSTYAYFPAARGEEFDHPLQINFNVDLGDGCPCDPTWATEVKHLLFGHWDRRGLGVDLASSVKRSARVLRGVVDIRDSLMEVVAGLNRIIEDSGGETERKLKPEYRKLADEFEAEDGICSCHVCSPCDFCTHPGNPDNLAENDDAWESR